MTHFVQARKSMGKRASVAGRPSSYLTHSAGVTLREDPRPLTDPSFKNEAIRKILTYLSENLYGDVLTAKTLVRVMLQPFDLSLIQKC